MSLREHYHNLVDSDKYGGWVEDLLIGMLAAGTLLLFIYCVLKSGGVI